MSALGPAAIAAADPAGMVGDVLAQPHQLGDALWRVESAGIPPRDLAGGLVVCGMGGSGVGGDLAAAVLAGRMARPVRTVHDYVLDPWTGPDTLVLVSSYSGHTEEALACFEAAGEAGAPRAVLTTGGDLAAAARAAGVPVIGAPSGMQPRAAVVYGTVAALECAALCGAGPPLRGEIEGAAPLLAGLAAEWGPEAPDGAEPKALAAALRGTVPVVIGSGPTAAVAARWRSQLAENAKLPASHAVLPEADHNDLAGWVGAPPEIRLGAVLLDDAGVHPRNRRRIALTAAALADRADAVRVTGSRGRTPFERIASLVMLGDLTSVYLAVLGGRDPTPVDALIRFKDALPAAG